MKLIEALKKIKDLERKAQDIRKKIKDNSAISSIQTPPYGTEGQTKKVAEWLQAHSDLLKEILRLRVAIQRTNLDTEVTVELGKTIVKKSLAEWIHRRRDLAKLEIEAYKMLTDRNIAEEAAVRLPSGEQAKVTIVRFFDPAVRDKMIDDLTTEISLIDGRLEIANAVTDLIE